MAGAFQSDAFQTDAFQLDAGGAASFTADAVLSVSQSSSFTANAVISVSQTGSFTADAVIVIPVWSDDFNRVVASGLGPRYYDQRSAYGETTPNETSVDGSAMVVGAGGISYWGGFSAPTTFSSLQFDFYVPAATDMLDPYYEIDVAGYHDPIDNLYYNRWLYAYPYGDGTWEYGGSEDFGNFVPDTDAWYTVKAHFPQIGATDGQRFKVWKVGDPEPDWAFTAPPETGAASPVGIYDIVGSLIVTTPTHAASLDNFLIQALGPAIQVQSFTVDAVIGAPSMDLTVDAVIAKTQTGSFTADAVLRASQSSSFTADSYIALYFTADAVIQATQSSSFTVDAVIPGSALILTVDAVIRASQSSSYVADAVLRVTRTSSFTVNAVKAIVPTSSLTVDAVVAEIFRSRHARTGPQHTGVDRETDHLLAWSFDRYLRGQNLREFLIDFDARLTAMESGFAVSHSQSLYLNAVLRAALTSSFTADASIQRAPSTFTLDAFIAFQKLLTADAWINNPAYYIDNSVLTAPTWSLNAIHNVAVINSSALTWDATNDPDWWYGPGESYLSGWAKFTLASPANVRIDTLNTQGDTVIELWTGGPGAWATDPVAYGDDDVTDPTNPYGYADVIDTTTGQGTDGTTFGPVPIAPLAAGTYWVLIHPFDQVPSPNFNLVLRIYLP